MSPATRLVPTWKKPPTWEKHSTWLPKPQNGEKKNLIREETRVMEQWHPVLWERKLLLSMTLSYELLRKRLNEQVIASSLVKLWCENTSGRPKGGHVLLHPEFSGRKQGLPQPQLLLTDHVSYVRKKSLNVIWCSSVRRSTCFEARQIPGLLSVKILYFEMKYGQNRNPTAGGLGEISSWITLLEEKRLRLFAG